MVIFGSLSSRITQLLNFYRHVDTQSLNTSLLEVMISWKNERVFIRDLSDLTLQIIFDAWWASMNVGSKRRIA